MKKVIWNGKIEYTEYSAIWNDGMDVEKGFAIHDPYNYETVEQLTKLINKIIRNENIHNPIVSIYAIDQESGIILEKRKFIRGDKAAQKIKAMLQIVKLDYIDNPAWNAA